MARWGQSVSVKDVARAAGVSTQTVSRVVNQSSAVAAETRQRVEEAIARLGYRRNELARNLIQGRTRTLGLVFTGRDHLGGSNINSGITAEAEALGYALLLRERRDDDSLSQEDFLHKLLERRVDGVLWMLSETRETFAPLLQRLMHGHGVPVVALVRSSSVGVPWSAFDNYGAGLLATRHLIERGRRRIGHIAGPEASWDAQERRRGWCDALRAAGLPADDALLYVGSWRPECGEAGLHVLRQRVPDLDAVFAANDRSAMGVLLGAHRLGLRIPEDLAVVGVDDIRGADWLYPPLTTVRQNQAEMGRQAVRMLARLVEARFAGEPLPVLSDYLHPPELVVRESS